MSESQRRSVPEPSGQNQDPTLESIAMQSELTDRPPLEWLRLRLDGRCVVLAKVRRSFQRAVVHFVTTHPGYRRRGLARQLVASLQRDRREVIARGVNYSARGFWERLGFTRIPESQDYLWRAPLDRTGEQP